MNEQQQREEALFHEAMELPSAEARAAFLTQACGNDAALRAVRPSGPEALRQRVEALIAAAQPINCLG